MLTNLLNNAAKYTPNGGQICRICWPPSIAITSAGRNDHLANVFQMFSQLEPAMARSQGSLGIGLALVKGLVALRTT